MLLRHLSYFIAVAEHRGFTRAAAALHVSQPALSQQIRQLEAMLEVQLFDRSGRYIRLTDAGEIWLEYARRALRDLEEGRRALHDAEDLQRGKLRIAMTPTFTTYMLGPLVENYYRRYPGVKLLIQEMNQERMEMMLLKDELDVGIAFDDSRSPDIVVQPLLTETLALVVSRTHPLARENALRLQALDAQPLILLSSEFATREQIDRYCRRHRLEPDVQMEANSIGAVLSSFGERPLRHCCRRRSPGSMMMWWRLSWNPRCCSERPVCSSAGMRGRAPRHANLSPWRGRLR